MGYGDGGREIIYLSLHCHPQNDPCIKTGSDESHFNVSLILRDKVIRLSTNHIFFSFFFLKRKVSRSGFKPRSLCLPALPLGHTSSQLCVFFTERTYSGLKPPRTCLYGGHSMHIIYIYILKYRSCRETDAHAKKSPGSGRTSEFKINRYEAQTTKLEHSIRSYFVVVDLDL